MRFITLFFAILLLGACSSSTEKTAGQVLDNARGAIKASTEELWIQENQSTGSSHEQTEDEEENNSY